jgi:uncharacterized protein (DUF1330 family)
MHGIWRNDAMPAYMVVQINVTDPEKFARYREAVPRVVESSGGRYIVRGGTVEVLEGTLPHRH